LGILDRLLEECVTTDGRVLDVRIGVHWTAVVVEVAGSASAGLAATLTPEGWEHGRPWVREASRLKEMTAARLASLVTSESPTERSVGLAALNALHQCSPDRVSEGNADEILFRLGRGKRVAVVGHFPFVDHSRAAGDLLSSSCTRPLDRPASKRPISCHRRMSSPSPG
jgi:uncharacterized protein (DUF4213/DUF364 family)